MKTQQEMKAMLIAEVKAQTDFWGMEIDLMVSEYKRLGLTSTILEFDGFVLEVNMQMPHYSTGLVKEDGKPGERSNLHTFKHKGLGPMDVALKMREQLVDGFSYRVRNLEEAVEALRVAEVRVQACERYQRVGLEE